MKRSCVSLAVLLASALCLVVQVQRSAAQESASVSVADVEKQARDARERYSEILDLITRYDSSEVEEDRLVLDTRITRRAATILQDLRQLTVELQRLPNAGQGTSARETTEALLHAATDLLRGEFQKYGDSIARLRLARDNSPPADLLDFEQAITRENASLDDALGTFLEIAGDKTTLGLDDAGTDLAYLDKELTERSEALSVQMRIAREQLNERSADVASTFVEGQAALAQELRALSERLHGTTSSLTTVVQLMHARSLPTTELKEQLIRQGNVTSDIFDTRVLSGLFLHWWDGLKNSVVTNGPQWLVRLFVFVSILLVTKFLAGIARRIVTRSVTSSDLNVPQLLKQMAVSLASKAVFVFGFLLALSQLGIEIGPLLAGLGVVGFIVGFALQETLSNFASGLMILVYRPFDVGDVVDAGGVSGKVQDMSLVSATILTFDNQRLMVPTRKIWGDVIVNKTAESTRRVDLVFRIGLEDDLGHAERVMAEVVRGHTLVLETPKPAIEVQQIGESSVEFIVRPWVKTSDYWRVYWDLNRRMKERFDLEGIRIPYPQRAVHVYERARVSQ